MSAPMSAPTITPLRIVLYEGPGSRALEPVRRFELLRALLAKGFQVTCPGSAADGTHGIVSSADASSVLVLGERNGGDFPLAENDVYEAADSGRGGRVHFRDISGLDGPGVVGVAEEVRARVHAYPVGEWKPWFPVIDFDRCTNCMQCLSFCLFDVYGVDGDKNIQVKNPDKCKTNCPACSRVCPDVAILFPKYGSGPINGAEVSQEDVDREKMKVDISALLGGDIYSMLRDRHERAKSRFSKERDEGKALKERMRCLKKLQEDADIPPEVLMSLPSAEEIQRKAAAAHRMAQDVLREREQAATADEN